MGSVGDTQKIDGGSGSGDKGGCFMRGMKSLVRRKQVDSANSKSSSASGSAHQLAKALTIPHLIAIGHLLFLVLLEQEKADNRPHLQVVKLLVYISDKLNMKGSF